jgi:hypothetical protein
MELDRRGVLRLGLGLLLGGASWGWSDGAEAQDKKGKKGEPAPDEAGKGKKGKPAPEPLQSQVLEIERDKKGTTLTLQLEQAPFPFPGKPWKDSTVLVYVPHHHRIGNNKGDKVHVVVHFHGHNTTAAQSMKDHQLREQFAESLQNAILVMPQGPVRAGTGHPGKLGEQDGLVRFLTDLRETLQGSKADKALGKAGLGPKTRVGMVCLSAHSGGYRTALDCVEFGGFEVQELWLFDSLYSEGRRLVDWVAAGKPDGKQWTHKLISYYTGGAVQGQNKSLMRGLEAAGLEVLHEEKEGTLTRAQLTTGRAIFIRTRSGHGNVTHTYNGLRDCLYASALPRNAKSDWFKDKNKPRELDERGE